jgi:hypothetical protein
MRSPGAIIEVVKIPEKAPARNSCVRVNWSSGDFICNRFPTPYPMKLIANIGATPAIGAPIPERNMTKMHKTLMKKCLISANGRNYMMVL